MGDLRIILVVAGLLFLGLLAWLGSRRPRRARDEPERPRGFADGGPRPDPTIGDTASGALAYQHETAASQGRALPPMATAPAEPRESALRRDPPVVEWADAITRPRTEPGLSSFEDMPVMQGGPSFGSHEAAGNRAAPVAAAAPAPAAAQPTTAAPAPTPATAPTAAAAPAAAPPLDANFDDPSVTVSAVRIVADPNELPPPSALVIDWPPEPERYIASLRVVAGRGEQIAGRGLRQALAACGFRHGPFGIFHLGLDDGRVLVSAASLVRPGLLDPGSMDFQQFPGLNLFAVLPAPVEPAEALERLCRAALDLADRIGGSVQDESGAPFGHEHTQDWRAGCIASFAQREPPAAAGQP